MRFDYAVLLTALVIAPVCAEHVKDSNERYVVNSMPSIDRADCDGGSLHSSGDDNDRGSGGGGCADRRRMVGGWWGVFGGGGGRMRVRRCWGEGR